MQIKVFDVVELKNNNLATILEIKDNKYFTSSLGDYHALAVSDKYLRYRRGCPIHISTHAGFTIDEMKVPLIIVVRGH